MENSRAGVRKFNFIPEDVNTDHPTLHLPEVKLSLEAIRKKQGLQWGQNNSRRNDIFDWLHGAFKFQADNVRNQRENLVMLLANSQMRLSTESRPQALSEVVPAELLNKLTENYRKWCAFHHIKNNANPEVVGRDNIQMQLIYSALFLLIWGEAGNLRFMPECLCYIFHYMANEVNLRVSGLEQTLVNDSPSRSFLIDVIRPIYHTLSEEIARSKEEGAVYAKWRNYDDMNEFFWEPRCFRDLGWPLNLSAKFLTPPSQKGGVRKTGFVERRSFLNLFLSFHRVWIIHIVLLQALAIVAFDAGSKAPWTQLRENQDTVASLCSCFITWAFLLFIQGIISSCFHWPLLISNFSRALKTSFSVAFNGLWTAFFAIIYKLMWAQRSSDMTWSTAAQFKFRTLLGGAFIFCFPQVFSILALLFPWLARVIEKSDWLIVRLFTWLFHDPSFVGRGLYESSLAVFMYCCYWIILLVVKFSFAYFLQIHPLVKPTQQLWNLDVKYKFPKFSSGHNIVALISLWAPVLLVYFLDFQIWNTVLSAVVGLFTGLFQHIGEIQDTNFLWRKFLALPQALSFNFQPKSTNSSRLSPWQKWCQEWYHYWTKITLRYNRIWKPSGLSKEPGPQFTLIWNRILESLRSEDLISNQELESLQMPNSRWRFSVAIWPTVLLSNEVAQAVQMVQTWESSNKSLIKRITKKEIRRCAVLEVVETLEKILETVVYPEREKKLIQHIWEILKCTATNEEDQRASGYPIVLTDLKLYNITQVQNKILTMLDALLRAGDAFPNGTTLIVEEEYTQSQRVALEKVVKTIQDLFETVVRDFLPETVRESVERLENEGDDESLLFTSAIELPSAASDLFWHARRIRTLLKTTSPSWNIPHSLEARRRLTFFCNSMFMDMPSPPSLRASRALTVLTPFYRETVAFSKKELQQTNEDGITMLYYLQQIFPDQWTNMIERLGLTERQLWSPEGKDGKYVSHWASFRGQTLLRTVRGIMYNREALLLLAKLEEDGEHGQLMSDPEIEAICDLKFQYVVACQVYGEQKKSGDPSAKLITELLQQYPALRVAYVDTINKKHYSVLVKWDFLLGREQEVYRIELPGPMRLGEGKPENQNHSIIFSRGDALQAMDMNQDFYLEEALKMRNFLEEFGELRGRGTTVQTSPRVILGMREHVFTGGVSSLAHFMSSQETAFVTLGQRVLASPLRVRMHYGHPDVFDRLWVLSRGGVSKASPGINLSEDIFAGFNVTLRGGSVSHHEYIQAGKGRDVGLSQIAAFEAKVASGNGEQTLSRDLYRLGHRVDIFRCFSLYFTTVGFFFSTLLTALTVFAFLWGRCYLALSGVEATLALLSPSATWQALTAALNQQLLIQLGVLTALPMLAESILENGLLPALWEQVMMQLQLASVFFTFSMGTRAHYFARTVMHGGATYRATGRGFVVIHESFAKSYRFFSRSHFLQAFEVIILLLLYRSYASLATGLAWSLITVSAIFLAFSWALAPFIFNPSGFDWLKLVEDWKVLYAWLWNPATPLTSGDQSWEVWWHKEFEHLKKTGHWGRLTQALLFLRFFFFQWAICYQLSVSDGSTSTTVYAYSWLCVLVLILASGFISFARKKFSRERRLIFRGVQVGVSVLIGTLAVLGFLFTNLTLWDVLQTAVAFLPTGWGIICLLQVLWGFWPEIADTEFWKGVVQVARFYELILILAIFVPVAILSWLPGVPEMQTRILFNNAFSRGLQLSKILGGIKPGDED